MRLLGRVSARPVQLGGGNVASILSAEETYDSWPSPPQTPTSPWQLVAMIMNVKLQDSLHSVELSAVGPSSGETLTFHPQALVFWLVRRM